MPARGAHLRVASSRDEPKHEKPIDVALVQKAFASIRNANPFSSHQDKLAEIRFHGAYSSAKLIDLQVKTKRLCDTGEPLAPGGERTKVPIKDGSLQHIKLVSEPFSKFFVPKDKKLAEQLAREIIEGKALRLFGINA